VLSIEHGPRPASNGALTALVQPSDRVWEPFDWSLRV